MRIGIGIPAFSSFAPQVAFDYMRMFYSFGRRYPEHEFALLTKTKSEQFRARNAIVETALVFGLDYLLFLDDDHIFNWMETMEPSSYEFLRKLLAHKKDIVGCLYYHRGGDYKPVLMKEYNGKYRFLNDTEIEHGLQRVDVQGGGCMLIDMKIFDKIKPPYFEPEQQTDGNNLGTDVQLCRKALEAGFEVWSDTSILVGHLKSEPEIITGENRDSMYSQKMLSKGLKEDQAKIQWVENYKKDIRDYLSMSEEEILKVGNSERYANKNDFGKYPDIKEYYISRGNNQACRQYYYHTRPNVVDEGMSILKHFRAGCRGKGLDFGCGTAPVGYELLQLGHDMDFVDIDGAGGYEFLKWRIDNRASGLTRQRAGWKIQGPYDFVIMLDIIEHLKDWEDVLDNIIGRVNENGIIVTNYFGNRDFANVEHINMDHGKVMEFFTKRNLFPRTYMYWQKQDNFLGGSMKVKNISQEAVDG